ncbi:hypothetical protein GURASL_34520 [Geotalea uraniireducens]|uniref:Dicarboxylate transport domain-containing protein n=1 Tax=Geotalea uraniireducens TaxID=351604 RepID=A0ABM8EPJ9_9BACT|nr:hypothetical protein [Geotalea uraniireducens]BDV44529.1 hypothetical protein GURASL_34520 [Geotalea uraniireducens]
MPRSAEPSHTSRRFGRLAACLLAALVLIVLALAILLKIYLATFAAPQLGRLLTGYLHYPVRIAGLELRGDSLVIRGVAVDNPSGFPAGRLATAEAVVIAPQWPALLRGQPVFRRVELERPTLELLRNRAGIWNVAGLRRPTKAKGRGAEVRIGVLQIRDGAVRGVGYGVQGLSLRLRELASRGSREGTVDLSCRDHAGNRYTLRGDFRPGATPDFALRLDAPQLALAPFAGLVRGVPSSALATAAGSLQLTAALRSGRYSLAAEAEVRNLTVPLAGRPVPLSVRLAGRGWYRPATDEARLESLDIAVDKLLAARLAGTVQGVRGAREFTISGRLAEVELQRLAALLLPAAVARRVALAGRLGSHGLRLTGSARRGIGTLSGDLFLQDGALSLDGRPLCRAVGGVVTFEHAGGELIARGRLVAAAADRTVPLSRLELPLVVRLSERLRPLLIETAPVTARFAGLTLTGAATFAPGTATPLHGELRLAEAPLAGLAGFLERYGVKSPTGRVSASLAVQGANLATLAGTAAINATGWQGELRSHRLTVGDGRVALRFSRRRGAMTGDGTLSGTGIAWDRTTAAARSLFSFDGSSLALTAGRFRVATTDFGAAAIRFRLLPRSAGSGGDRPLAVSLNGGTVSRDQLTITGLAGSWQGALRRRDGRNWPAGDGSLSLGQLAVRGQPLASGLVRFALAEDGGTAELAGTVAGGPVTARLVASQGWSKPELAFAATVTKAGLGPLQGMLAGKKGVTVTGGQATGTVTGHYGRATGLDCRGAVQLAQVALAGAGGKSILSDGGLRLTGQYAGAALTVDDAVVTAGEAVAVRLKGRIGQLMTPQRQGTVAFSLAPTPVNELIDPVVNILPRMIQEATVAGTVAVAGLAAVNGPAVKVDGALSLAGVRLEVPSQRLVIGDISGTIPVDYDSAAPQLHRPPEATTFTRARFPALRDQLARPAAGRELTIGAVRFGPLNLGETTMVLQEGDGIVRIVALRSRFYDGAIFGRGFVALRRGIAYGGDLLVDGMSLQQLCSAIPKIQGYVSGRLDGGVSLYGEGSGLAGLRGFTDLWARKGKQERMLLSKEFLQRLAGKKLRGFFFRNDRPYDRGELSAYLEGGFLTFTTLDISHTDFLGIRDLSVTVAPLQNRIALDHLFSAIREAAARGKAVRGAEPAGEAPADTQFNWRD